ncbi:hypothetical protein AN618_03400 [Fervidicola ferrireducens]|uniref:Uncharacterized protein n=1 Tax=Fervidicola ferrireducens TaxID=520764 RepID=A0A140LDF9_9FIRM|nr:hypothetical protein [Fervidicola ferrireducens]KXG78584.1 hypothetical protein AN618_03400 [Fervidicola ferrireducens]
MNSIQGMAEAFSESNQKLESLCNQIKSNMTNDVRNLKNIQDSLKQVKSYVETSLKDLEAGLEQNQSLLSKWLAGSNTKLLQKQVGQQRINILEKIAEVENALDQFTGVFESRVENFNSSAQKLILDLKNIENQLKNGLYQPSGAYPEANVNPVMSIQQTIQQVLSTLNAAQENILRNRVLSQFSNSLDNMLQ